MQRTNVYLEEKQLRALKHLAAEEQHNVSDLVRKAIDDYLAKHFHNRDAWGDRFDALIERIQSRVPADVTADEIEAEITAAREEVRTAHRASTNGDRRARGR